MPYFNFSISFGVQSKNSQSFASIVKSILLTLFLQQLLSCVRCKLQASQSLFLLIFFSLSRFSKSIYTIINYNTGI